MKFGRRRILWAGLTLPTVWGLGALRRSASFAAVPGPDEGAVPAGKDRPSPFDRNVKVSFTKTHMIVESDGLPTHKTATYPNRDNPNRILAQKYVFRIPLEPRRAAQITPLPMGPIGVAINGIPFYNPYNHRGQDAVVGPAAEVFDSCCGHPDPRGRYHYHKYPVCVRSPFKSAAGEHSPLIGFAFDGYAIHGPHDAGGKPPTDLDECNGHSDDTRGYHYHVTESFPYILGGYRGEVEAANLDGPPRGGPGGNGGPGGRPPRGFGPPPGGRPPR